MVSRRFIPRFGIRCLFALVAVCALLAAYWASRLEQKQFARHVEEANRMADLILLADHFYHDQRTFRAMQARVDALHLKRHPDYLLPNQRFKNGDPADDFETDLLLDLKADKPATDVYIRRGVGNAITYYKVIRQRTSCRTCHGIGDIQPDQPLAVMKIALNASPP